MAIFCIILLVDPFNLSIYLVYLFYLIVFICNIEDDPIGLERMSVICYLL